MARTASRHRRTGDWQAWATVTATMQLAAGQQTLAVDQDNGGWNLRTMAFTSGGGGTPPPAALTASPSSVSFGSVTVGSTSGAQSVAVSNPGTSAAPVSSVSVTGPFSQSNPCGSSISAGGSCTVSVMFAPTAAGSASGTLSVASSASGSPLTVALSGTGTSTTPVSTNLALHAAVSASSYPQTYAPGNAVDGDAARKVARFRVI